MPRHLLDRRLNPVASLRESAAVELQDFADVPADVALIPLMVELKVQSHHSKASGD